jgi:hypothetical protein
MDEPAENNIEHFIARWRHADGGERPQASFRQFPRGVALAVG